MEVTHINHLDTHAIIGGGDVQTFSAKLDAEFFEILSSTLYANKKLAVVREVLCNSWDANIENGMGNKPVVVSISDSEMVFKDFGAGIPKDLIAEIYCSYGGSTKRENKTVTGGFGLGTKAPFAYSKNFSVTTCNGGVKSIFNISRGTAATNGVPDLRCMVSVPTTETGITVSIPINKSDREEFENLVKALAYMGGILVNLNGKTLRRIPYYDVEAGLPFILVPNQNFPPHLLSGRSHDKKYFVKYGAVVYPIPEDFAATISITCGHNTNLITSRSVSIIFLAPPGSIGVTPSRETLSMTDKTKETLRDLIKAANEYGVKLRPSVIDVIAPEYTKQGIDHAFENSSSAEFIASVIQNPLTGYQKMCDSVRHSFTEGALPRTAINTPDMIGHMKYEFLHNAHGVKDVVAKLTEQDKDGQRMLELAKKQFLKKYPEYGPRFFRQILSGRSFNSVKVEYEYKCLRKLSKFMKHLDNMGGNTFIDVHHWDNDYWHGERIAEESEKLLRKTYHYHSRIDSLFSRVFADGAAKPSNVHIFLAQSEISVRRVIKAHPKITEGGAAMMLVIARKRKNYEKLKAFLTEQAKASRIVFTPDLDVLPKPIESMTNAYKLAYEDHNPKAVKVAEDFQGKYFILSPASYMIPKVKGDRLNQRKIAITDEIGKMLIYLYGDILVVPGLGDASALEKKGYINVFKALAEDVEEYFSDVNNHENLMNELSSVSGYFRSHRLNQLLEMMSPSVLLEALGKEPRYVGSDKPLPSIIHTFFALLKLNHTPQYGFQHIQRCAGKTQGIFDDYFGTEIRAIISDDLMEPFFNNLPNKIRLMDQPQVAIFRAATLGAMQTVKVYQQLRKQEKCK